MSRMDKVEYNSLKGEIWNIKKVELLKTDDKKLFYNFIFNIFNKRSFC